MALIISIGVNVVLATGWYQARHARILSPPMPPMSADTNLHYRNRVHVVSRLQNISWKDVESDDYVTYIRNLRTIGCPEKTIRDIIVADVNELYAHRRATEIVGADQQWWRSDPDRDLVKEAIDKLKALDVERNTLLTKLLGPNWDADLAAPVPAIRALISLTGPLLGDLSAGAKQSVYNAAVKMQEKLDSYREAQRQQGKPEDPLELLKIREAARTELASVLTPPQLEEFLLRYSQTAKDLRDELRGLDPTPDEFRALFQARDKYDSQAELYYTGDDAEAIKKREDLEAKREKALLDALGTARYTEYKLNQDPTFKDVRSTVEGLGLDADVVLPMYQIEKLTQAEMQRIRSDDSMTLEEKIEALGETQTEQQRSMQILLGDEAYGKILMRGNRRQK
jgi:hypothetical protein